MSAATILSALPGLSYIFEYHSVCVRLEGSVPGLSIRNCRVPLDLPPTVHYSRGGGWYEFVEMPRRPR